MSDYEYKMDGMISKAKDILTRIRDMNYDDLSFYDVKNEWIEDIISDASNQMNAVIKSGLKIDAKSASPLQKICCYKICKMNIDCDVSLFNILIYAIAYNMMDAKIESQIIGDKYCVRNANVNYDYYGDTMNSYSKSLRSYLRKFNESPDIYMPNSKELKNEYVQISKENYWDACILDNYDYFDKLIPNEIKMFIRVNHTLGNFIPVPFRKKGMEFNSPRGFGSTKDYWDLALLKIYNWYDAKNNGKPEHQADEYLKQLITSPQNINLCKEWLGKYTADDGKPSWDVFVVANYMQDFVKKGDAEGHFSEPKELWTGHFKNNVLPSKEDFIQFFTNAYEWIIARGNRISIKLKNELKGKSNEELEELVRQLFVDKY